VPICTNTCVYVCQWVRRVLVQGASCGEYSIDFFMQLSKMETHPHIVHLSFSICEMHLISACLPSTCAHTIYKFSPTSPARSNAHQILNPRQSMGFEDVKHLVLHAVLLASGPLGDHWNKYVRICCNVHRCMLAQGASHREYWVYILFCAC
jgi:hypothetical protein